MQTRPLLLEFPDVDALTAAADTLRASGLWDTAWAGAAPAHGDAVTLDVRARHLLRAAALGAALFACAGWALRHYAMLGEFGPEPWAVALEMAMVGAAVSAAATFLAAAWLAPHPLAGVEIPQDAARDRYFLVLHGAAWQQQRVLERLRAHPPCALHTIVDGALCAGMLPAAKRLGAA